MNKSKLTLVIDGNWLLMSRLCVLGKRYATVEQLSKDLQLLMVRSIKVTLKLFPNIDNVIFVTDGGSWRNYESDIPKFLKENGIEYKGNRSHESDIDLDVIFKGYEDFINLLSENGITVSKEKMVEGDDWCLYWSKYLNNIGTNVIIWSKDKDLTQLVNTYDNGVFTVFWNKENGLTCKASNEDELDFLMRAFSDNNQLTNNKLFESVCQKSKIINKINPTDVVLEKIIRGDLGDNILPILTKKSQNANSGRTYKISVKDIDYDLDPFDDDAVKKYINKICNQKQYLNRANNKSEKDIYEHFIYNRKLVALDKRNIPESIKEKMEKSKLNICKDFSNIESMLKIKSNDISILDEI